MRLQLAACVWVGIVGVLSAAEPAPPRVLFDFETADQLKAWTNLELPDAKEPAARVELSADHAASGKQSLRITFAGGRWPTITTTHIPADWSAYHTFKASVTVSRTCLVGFTALQEKSSRAGGWDGCVSRWTKTEILQPGTTDVTAILHPNDWSAINPKLGKVVRFEIFMYNPRPGESIHVDHIRLLPGRETPPAVKNQFQVAGTDLTVSGVQKLGKLLRDRWSKPASHSVEEVETAFRQRFVELKKSHPQAVLAILRDGEKGFDPAQPERAYAGWRDAYWSSHGPDGMTRERTDNRGQAASHEVFMRHRSPLMRVELSSIPKGSRILAAELVLVRSQEIAKDRDPTAKPTMWVAEPCNRPWVEAEVNAYEYARDRFWKRVGGMHWGDDPDFLPIYLAHGPGGVRACTWDFAEAVRFWTAGQHANHGFMLHGDSGDYLFAHSREAKEVRNRPAVLVVYVPG